jgi:hypothetical protein
LCQQQFFEILIGVYILVYKLERKNIYILIHKTYLKKKVHKIIGFRVDMLRVYISFITNAVGV